MARSNTARSNRAPAIEANDTGVTATANGEIPGTPETQTGNEDTAKKLEDATSESNLKLEGSATSGKFRPRGLAEKYQTMISSDASQKVLLMSQARQRLAEAFDLDQEGNSKASEAQSIAAEAGLALYQGRSAGLISADEVTSILGDQYGFKTKKDGTPSKTPDGRGEELRKRIVRMASAYAFAYKNEGNAFFDKLDPDEVKGVLAEVEDGRISIYTAHNTLAEMKRDADNSDKVDPAFNPKTVMKWAETLANEGSVDAYRNNPELVRAWATLIDVFKVMDEAALKADEAEAEGE